METEQPRETKFYPNEVYIPIGTGEKTEKTLQSINATLKRIEAILLEQKNNLPSKIGLHIDGKEFAKIAFQSIHGTCEVVR